MRTHKIPSCAISLLCLLSCAICSNYPCLKHIFMVPKVFEPLKFYCILDNAGVVVWVSALLETEFFPASWFHFMQPFIITLPLLGC